MKLQSALSVFGLEHVCPGCHLLLGVPQGQDLTRAMSRQEVTARLGDQECEVKTLDNTHLYCEPPEIQPMSAGDNNELPSLKVTHTHTDIFMYTCSKHFIRFFNCWSDKTSSLKTPLWALGSCDGSFSLLFGFS